MPSSPLLGASALLAGLGLAWAAWSAAPAPAAPAPATPATAVADGHYVLVVDGDRDQLTVTHAQRKADPWGGVPQGLDTGFTLAIEDSNGGELLRVPLDVRPFATDAASKGAPRRVEGCLVIDSHIAMLVNVPALRAAARYVFRRGDLGIGTVAAGAVEHLAGGGR